MQRVTMTLDDGLLAELDALAAARGYQNRSEAARDLLRAGMREAREDAGAESGGACVGALVYVYDHEARELPKRLTRSAHAHAHLSLATLHVHMDHDTCLEVAILKGAPADVRAQAGQVIAERGVRHGRLVLLPGS